MGHPSRRIVAKWTRLRSPVLSPGIHGDEAQAAPSPGFEQHPGRRERDGAVGSQLQVTAVVQAGCCCPYGGAGCAECRLAPAPPAPAESVASQSCAVTFHITGVRPSSLAVRSTSGRRAPNGGRNHFTASPVASSMIALQPASSSRTRAGRSHSNEGWLTVWFPSRWPACCMAAGDFRTLAYKAAHQEEGRPHLMASQQIEQLQGVGIIRTVIEGEGDFLNIGAGDNGAAEELRSRRLRGIGIAPSRKPGNQTRGDQLGEHASRV